MPGLGIGNSHIFTASYQGANVGESESIAGFKLLLEGDMQSGTDYLLLEGDMQAGTDVLLLEGTL